MLLPKEQCLVTPHTIINYMLFLILNYQSSAATTASVFLVFHLVLDLNQHLINDLIAVALS